VADKIDLYEKFVFNGVCLNLPARERPRGVSVSVFQYVDYSDMCHPGRLQILKAAY